VLHVGGVLGRNHHVDDAGRLVVDVFDRNLRLRIRAQPLGQLASLADAGEFAAETVGEHDGRRHQLRRLVAGVAEHDALIAGSLFLVLLAGRALGIHPLGDVRALDGQVVRDENLVGVEDVVAVRVADPPHGIADDLADVNHLVDRLGGAFLQVLQLGNGDFPANHDHVALHEGFAGHAALGIVSQAGVEDGVRNGVGNFVRMAFADGL
jgi:hypothetical protein